MKVAHKSLLLGVRTHVGFEMTYLRKRFVTKGLVPQSEIAPERLLFGVYSFMQGEFAL